MHISAIDWAIVAAYFILSAGIGFAFTKKGGESLSEYFISGRAVPWWLAGTSMVATTFAADTPLVVTGLVASRGVAGNWLWWNMLMSGMLTVFFFARLWRRANVLTDVEFAEVRYGGRPAASLRVFRALYLAIPINLIILGWVTRAMIKILTISLGLRDYTLSVGSLSIHISGEVIAVGICFVITVAYSVAAGMWAVLWTDLIQFVVKMSAVIILAVYAVKAVGGMDLLKVKLIEHFGSERAATSVLPVSFGPHGVVAYAWMPLLTLGVFLSVQWWAAWYPGAEPGGGGYIAQRIFSARTERDGVLATLFFQVAHYALRPWPWIITGLATVVLYPTLQDKESGYVHAFVDLLPTPWRGVMMAGFAAAYMSTVATQLNWGASYLVNDVYKRFINNAATDRHYVAVSRWATIFLFLASTLVTWQLSSVEKAWTFLLAIGAGTGLVLILRWYWWRITAWSEISAMIASFVISAICFLTVPGRWFALDDPRNDSVIMLITVAASTVVWVTVTFLTQPESDDVLDAFYHRVRPGGPGWERVSTRLGYGREGIPGGSLAWTNWIAGIIGVYSTLFGIGKLIFGELGLGFLLLAIAAIAFAWIARSFQSEPPPARPAHVDRPEAIAAD
jgi:solute:Na+ symporter, SSS family